MLRSAATLPAKGCYHQHDGLGSVIMLTNAGGSVVERYRYDVFGYVTILDAAHAQRPATGHAPRTQSAHAPRAATAHHNRFHFTGREWLAELDLYDYRNRTYSPNLGRFLQTDPIRFRAGDVNLYRYAANNSKNFVDPLGLQGGRSKQRHCCQGVPYNKRTQCCVSGIIVEKIKRHERLGLSLGECVGRYTLDSFESMALGGFSKGIGFKNPWVGAGVAALILLDQAEATNRCLELVCP